MNAAYETMVLKVLKGLGISVAGAVLAGFIVLVPEVNELIQKADPINWSAVLLVAWGALSTSLVNLGRQWYKVINPSPGDSL